MLLENWVTTDNGAKPKTWNNLIDILSEIEELQPLMDEIQQNLIEEGVTLIGVYKFSYVYMLYICMYLCMHICTVFTRMEAWVFISYKQFLARHLDEPFLHFTQAFIYFRVLNHMFI